MTKPTFKLALKLTLKRLSSQVIVCWVLFFLFLNPLWSSEKLSSETKPYDIHIAVASNFYTTLASIVELFEAETGHHVSISSGASGILSTQILRGAPFDLFFSADTAHVKKLVQQGIIEDKDTAIYARGILLLVANLDNTYFNNSIAHEKDVCGLARLSSHSSEKKILKMAMAKPELAPYGEASFAFMKQQFPELVQNKQVTFIYGNNVSQVAQYFSQAGVEFAWLPLSMKEQISKQEITVNIKQVCFYQPPIDSYPAIIQVMAIVKKENPVALEFWQFVKSEKVKSLIRQAGYLNEME